MTITRDFFQRDTLTVAEELCGCRLESTVDGVKTAGIIVETEAYLGPKDKAAHSYKGRTERVRALYGPKGCAYIYLIYGMYWCLNLSAGPGDAPECVLLRALEPTEGIEAMKTRRGTENVRNLCSGPGKLTGALGITGALYGADLCGGSALTLFPGEKPVEVARSKRIGVDYAEEAKDFLYRFTVAGSSFLSRK